jgi:serine/threonine protein kinase
MGIVFEAMHIALGRRVAVKTLLAETGTDPELAIRFEREARAASAIGHPHIVDVFDLGRSPEGLLFMAMEFLDGKALATILSQTPCLPVALAINLTAQVLGGLAAAHKNEIIHRDLKPDNIFILDTEDRPNFVKIVDFGIAKILARPGRGTGMDTASGTSVGTVMGTPLYMSPEQILGQVAQINHRTDIYSAGVVLYEMLCGRTPFEGENHSEVFSSILDGRYPRPRDLRPEIPAQVEAVIVRALDRDMDRRFPSAAAMREAITGKDAEQTPSMEMLILPSFTESPARARPSHTIPGVASPPPVFNMDPIRCVPRARALPLAQALPIPNPPIELDRPAPTNAVAVAPRPAPRPSPGAPPKRSRIGLPLGLLTLVVVAGLGYVLFRPPTRKVPTVAHQERHGVTLSVDPPNALLLIDHLPVAKDDLFFDPGTSHVLEATAPGRVSRSISFESKPDLSLAVHLGRTLDQPLSADPEPLPSEWAIGQPPEPALRHEIDAAFAKLDRYATCLVKLGFAEEDTRKASPSAVPSNSVMSGCVQLANEAKTLAPPMVPLHDAGSAYLRGVFEGQSAGTLHRLLASFRSQYLVMRVTWQMEELSRQKADDGATVAWHLRRVVLAAQAWLRASRGSASQPLALRDSRARLAEYQDALLELTRKHPKESERISGAGQFLKSLEEVVSLARADSGRRSGLANATTACRRLVLAFNALVL